MKISNRFISVGFSPEGIVIENKTSRSRYLVENFCQLHCWDMVEMRDLRVDLPVGRLKTEKIDEHRLKIFVNEPVGYSQEVGINAAFMLTLNGNSLRLKLLMDEFSEPNYLLYRLLKIEILPGLGAEKTGKEGYLFLPNRSGILTYFKERPENHFDLKIYDQNSMWEYFTDMPVFGISGKNSGIFGVFSEADCEAGLSVNLNQGREHLNWVHPQFLMRDFKHDFMEPSDREVVYHFLSGSENDWRKMAFLYREFLLKEKGVQTIREKAKTNPVLDYYSRAHFVKIFCAAKDRSRDGKGVYRTYTTFEQANKILSYLKKNGFVRANVMLVGWNTDGHDGLYPCRLPPDPRLGGESKFREYLAYATKLGFQAVVHDEMTGAYAASPDFNPALMAKDYDGEYYSAGVWAGGYSMRGCPEEMLKHFVKRDLPRMKELGCQGVYYVDASPLNLLRCYDPAHPLTRTGYARAQNNIFQYVRDMFGGVCVECANNFALGTVDAVAQIITWPYSLDGVVPYLKCCGDEIVPFMHLAVHGIISYHHTDPTFLGEIYDGSREKGILKEIELGALPRIELTWEKYSGFGGCYQDMAYYYLRQHEIQVKRLSHLQQEFITSYERTDENHFRVGYSNGDVIETDYKNLRYGLNGKWEKLFPAKKSPRRR